MKCVDCLREDGGHEKGCPAAPNAPKSHQTMFRVGFLDRCKGLGPNSEHPSYKLGWEKAMKGDCSTLPPDALSFGIV
jgi:hypothetical protein